MRPCWSIADFTVARFFGLSSSRKAREIYMHRRCRTRASAVFRGSFSKHPRQRRVEDFSLAAWCSRVLIKVGYNRFSPHKKPIFVPFGVVPRLFRRKSRYGEPSGIHEALHRRSSSMLVASFCNFFFQKEKVEHSFLQEQNRHRIMRFDADIFS